MKKTNKNEFLTPYEAETMADLTPRQLKIMDILKSWYITRGKDSEDNTFTLSASQMAKELKCSTSTVQRDLVVLEGQGWIEREKVKLQGTPHNTSCFHLPIFQKNHLPKTEKSLTQKSIENTENEALTLTQHLPIHLPRIEENEQVNDQSISISNSISKSISLNNNISNNKVMNSITLNNNVYTVTMNFETLDELESIKCKLDELFGNSTTTPSTKMILEEKQVEVRGKEQQTTNTCGTPTTPSRFNELSEKVGKVMEGLKQYTNEVRKMKDEQGTLLQLSSSNHYAQKYHQVREWLTTHGSELSPKQLEVLNSMNEKYLQTIESKREHVQDFISGKLSKKESTTTSQPTQVMHKGEVVQEDEVIRSYHQLIPEVQMQLANYQRTKDKADSPKELIEVMQSDLLPMVRQFNTSLYNEWQNELSTLLQATNRVTESVILENTVVETIIPTTVEVAPTEVATKDIVVEEDQHPKSDVEELVEALTAEDEDDYGISCIHYSTVVA